jgi:N-methylhydantoinase A/oxoprolinase/acetone carboxylase beta subunit
VEATVHRRDQLPPGVQVEGPAVIVQYDTTTFVPPGCRVEVAAGGSLLGSLGRG